MIYDIVQVVPFEDYTVYVYFEDGKIVCYDAKPLLDKKVFEPLRDKDFFLNSCTILNGTLAWDVTGTRDTSKCLDIDPDTLYELENVKEKIVQLFGLRCICSKFICDSMQWKKNAAGECGTQKNRDCGAVTFDRVSSTLYRAAGGIFCGGRP